jgi:hypothetical protein
MISLLEKLKAGTRNIHVIKFPGTDQDVALRVLTNAETQAALFEAETYFKKRGIEINSATIEAFTDEHTTRQLAFALRDPDNPDIPFSQNADELRSLLVTAEKDILVEEYSAFEEEASPSPDNLSEEEMDRILEEVKKKPETGNALSISLLRKLFIYSVNRPST